MLDGELGVMLYVSDLKRTVEFLRDGLGFGFTGYWDNASGEVVVEWEEVEDPGYASVRIGDDEIGLHPDSDFEPGETRIKLSFTVEDVDAVHRRAVEHGVEATEPQDRPWGARMFTVTDHDGHEYDFLTPLDGAQ